ncbi:putative metal-dependent hydrolase [Solitalea sp. MAHUQ-68]|uniref:Metal-dependent hydrolase n=1 Tax=Solitalea agri TaxID=2953739 RepID=A0A9X2F206_9SPHI|nr:putative metal-dependent hydrolase [Solitalea agri]MCO4292761.1 putative metal-dependent hydrolase [Solitalea agri]
MEEYNLENLKYPIGRFNKPEDITQNDIEEAIKSISELPEEIEKAIAGLSSQQLDTPYRTDGWTVRQVIHHIPDSHMNAYIRFKLALTEENPTVKPYLEDKWAELEDTKQTPIEISLQLLKSLHQRWVVLLRGMNSDDFNKTFFHPERCVSFTLAEVTLLYDWHGRHHLGHILLVKNR